jgi:phage tail-like protein
VPDRHGPYRNARFLLEIEGVAKAGFSRCRLPERRTDVVEYREGNEPPTPRKLAGLNRYGPLVLETGITDDSIALFEWQRQVERGQVDEARRTIAVVVLDEEGSPGPRYEFERCWPHRYEPSDLDATGECVMIESLEVVTEGFERVA